MTSRLVALSLPALCATLVRPWPAAGQNNFEIQVYGSETVAPGTTMVELHSNVAAEGSPRTVVHETLDITQGITSWFETGFSVFTSIQPDTTWEWVGNHIRPRGRAPESWHLPIGVSLSSELGYQGRAFSVDTWTLELRPIIDKQWGRGRLDQPGAGPGHPGRKREEGLRVLPRRQDSYNVTPKVAIGLEYYGALGSVTHFDRPGSGLV